MRVCEMPDCDREHAARGLCLMHYKRLRKNGSPTKVLNPVGVAAADRWSAKVRVDTQTGCWLWQGSKDGHGYGMFHVGRRSAGVSTHIIRAHIFGYQTFVGPVADGLEIDHLCRQKDCVNPAHLEPVTHTENMFRTRGESCFKGHNDWIESTTQRYCLTCRRERACRS